MKVTLFKGFLFALLFAITSNVYAEYYLVYTPDGCAVRKYYRSCAAPCTVYIRSSAPYRHNHSHSSYQVEEYAWIPTP